MTEFAANLVGTNIEDEMRSSYLDYSMSVIVGRALPSARDGLKPVHRRILYAMHQEGLVHNRRYSKCAGVVGEVLKKYHPHGDSSVYDALVRMVQPWNMRYPLIDGQGNFGNIDGDAPAAYRYTECRMARIAEDLLSDIEKETVDWTENFDGTTLEPLVLPTRVPNLLVNGSSGIAVGMATNVAPHNLGEVVDGTLALLDNPELPDDELLRIIPGPDFPTGGVIYGRDGCIEAFRTGRGRVIVRAVAEIEKDENGDETAIVVTEIPYQVNKGRLLETLGDLVRQKKVEGVRDVRDESDRQGMRIVVELKRDAIGTIVLNQLYKHTALQSTFGVINLALVAGRPRVLSTREILEEFVAHRKEVTIRRCRFELTQAEARAHVLEGFLRALDVLDAIIALIRAAADTDVARNGLISEFGFTHVQAQAILDMRLAKLTGLEREKLRAEHAETLQLIERLRAILSNEALVREEIRRDLLEIRNNYADSRRTKLAESSADLSLEDLVPDEDVVVTLSSLGYVKRTPLREYEAQKRGGMGKRGMSTREEDYVKDLFVARTHDRLMCFTTMGRVYLLGVYEVPEGGRAARGRPMVNLVGFEAGEELATVLAIREFDEQRQLLMVTRGGMIKRSALSDYRNIRANGIIACGLKEGDQVLAVRLMESAEGSVLLATAQGKCIHFDIQNEKAPVREMGRAARGVIGIQLVGDDRVVGVEVAKPELTLLTLTANGFGKRTPMIVDPSDPNRTYRKQSRGGIGLIDIKTRGRNGDVVGIAQVAEDDEIVIVTTSGKVIRTRVKEVRVVGRNTQGVRLIRLEDGEKVVSFARIAEGARGEADEEDEESMRMLVRAGDADAEEPGPDEGAEAEAEEEGDGEGPPPDEEEEDVGGPPDE
jgi:DNA gyrase subunit A